MYQDPKEVDKLMKIESTLTEVTLIVHKSLDDVAMKINLLASKKRRNLGISHGKIKRYEHS